MAHSSGWACLPVRATRRVGRFGHDDADGVFRRRALVEEEGRGAARSLEAQVPPRAGPSERGEVPVHGRDGVSAGAFAIDRGSAFVVPAFSGVGHANSLRRPGSQTEVVRRNSEPLRVPTAAARRRPVLKKRGEASSDGSAVAHLQLREAPPRSSAACGALHFYFFLCRSGTTVVMAGLTASGEIGFAGDLSSLGFFASLLLRC